MKTNLAWLGPAVCAASLSAQVAATIAIDTTKPTPLNANFSGFNDEAVFTAEYYDYNFNRLAAQLSPGWVRYPAGTNGDAFDWQTGLEVPSWAAQFDNTNTSLTGAMELIDGKGGDIQ